MKISLVIQSYGSNEEYSRAIFSIWSFYVYCSIPQEQTTVTLFTDNPDYFAPYLIGLPIKFILLTPEKLKQMRGEIDFVHRVKIAAIEEAFDYTEEKLLYIDSDSFFIRDPVPYAKKLSQKKSFMHVNEYAFEEMKEIKLPAGKTFHIFYDFVSSNSFALSDGSSILISPKQISWNAGVILLHKTHQRVLTDVYRLTDSFYAVTKNHGCEQYAFSIILDRETELSGCEDMVYHYWVVVKKRIADKFLASRITPSWAALAPSEKIQLVRKWTIDLPAVFENDVLMLRTRAINSFQENEYQKGYYFAFRALWNDPFFIPFWKDFTYYILKILGLKKR